ncbi:TMEM165/GDT1 family protein [Prochlorococcus marinus]|uniref:TMEM165/GDT1 family protein n=1 Tax=Prochlorococcus marinus TaxID=1219 RepID=UPI0022B394EA|nr:TMEM165/GDT1 family protein [Prochlorococcus marinus]
MTKSIIISTFITIFLAELGDKTQIATLAISGTSKKPLAVFIGSSTALIIASLIGVLLGGSFANFIPESIIKSLAAIGFLVIGITLLIGTPEQSEINQDAK